MDQGLMVVGAVLVGIAALFGLALWGFEMARRDFPQILGFIHPTLAMAGLLMLVARFFIRGGAPWFNIGLLLLLSAAAAGLVLLIRGVRKRSMIRTVTVLHGILGLSGLGFVLYQITHR
jgi:peptidoglycan/LPS O-acetylase OafA/YrhL